MNLIRSFRNCKSRILARGGCFSAAKNESPKKCTSEVKRISKKSFTPQDLIGYTSCLVVSAFSWASHHYLLVRDSPCDYSCPSLPSCESVSLLGSPADRSGLQPVASQTNAEETNPQGPRAKCDELTYTRRVPSPGSAHRLNISCRRTWASCNVPQRS